jgi:tetratricopeptide (TPR) repeat protein
MTKWCRLFTAAMLAAAFVGGRVAVAQASGAQSEAAILRSARSFLSARQPERAEEIIQVLLAREPDNVEALTIAGQIRIAQGKIDYAEKLLLRALDASPNAEEANLLMGDLLFAEHHDPEAMVRFETVLDSNPHNAAARKGELSAVTELALAARKAGHPEASLQALQHARTSLPDDPELLYELGIQADELHMLPEAAEALNTARKLDPKNLDVVYALARVEIDQQHMVQAESDLRKYLAARPNDASAHFGLGHVLAMDQRIAEARSEFERSIQLQPAQTESYYQLGQLELDAQRDAAAEPLFLKALTRDPNHGGALTGMGVIAFRAKNYAKADEYLAAAEKTAPEYGPAHYYRGLSLARLGKKEESDAELHIATELGKAAPPATTAPTNH